MLGVPECVSDLASRQALCCGIGGKEGGKDGKYGSGLFPNDMVHVSRPQLRQSKQVKFFLVCWILGTNVALDEADGIWDMHRESNNAEAEPLWPSSYCTSFGPAGAKLDRTVHSCAVPGRFLG